MSCCVWPCFSHINPQHIPPKRHLNLPLTQECSEIILISGRFTSPLLMLTSRTVVRTPMRAPDTPHHKKRTDNSRLIGVTPMAIKRIPTASVQVGMYLCGIDRSWLETPFLRHRFLIKSSTDIAKLHQCGIQEITIDTEHGLDEPSGSNHHLSKRMMSLPHQTLTTTNSSVPTEVERIQKLPHSRAGKITLGGTQLNEARTAISCWKAFRISFKHWRKPVGWPLSRFITSPNPSWLTLLAMKKPVSR